MLEVDLSRGTIEVTSIPVRYLETYLGGTHLGARYLWDLDVHAAGPLDPENTLLWLTGPLTGTNFPGAGRLHIMARSPLTGYIGESSLGGYIASPLKLAGYDGILFRGRSPSPVYLEIDGFEGQVHLRPADALWGKDSYISEAELREMYPGRTCHVACIGPAGENLVPMSSIVHNRQYIAARTGMGAVMGSKRLKAVAVFAKGKLEMAHPKDYKELRKQAVGVLDEDYWSQRRKRLGTIGNLEWAVKTTRAPTKNWQDAEWIEPSHAITGETLSETYLTGQKTCHGCPIVCKRVVEIKDHPFALEEGPGPEYETGVSLGALLLNKDLPGLLKANELCNRLGLDTISVGGTLAWAMEANERGMLDSKWLEGLDLGWGNPQAIVELVRRIGHKEGRLGEALGQGSGRAAEIIGNGSQEFVMQVKGLELGYHHPREARGMEITYATNPRGAVHTEAPNVFGLEKKSYESWVAKIAETVDQSSLANAYVLCQFNTNPLSVDFLGKVVTAVTGDEWDEDRLTRTAERGWYLKRSFNLKCGAGREEDMLPKRIRKQLIEASVDHQNFDYALERYLDYRELDEKGFPSKEKLHNLELDDVSQALWHG